MKIVRVNKSTPNDVLIRLKDKDTGAGLHFAHENCNFCVFGGAKLTVTHVPIEH